MDLKQLQADPAAFRSALRIDADGRSVSLGQALDPWQAADFNALDAGWKQVAGQQATGPQRAYLERPRGHSKTADLAVMATWALFASRNRINGFGAAADQDQAKLLRDAIERLVRLNPWLSKILAVKQLQVTNRHTGSTLEILSSDAPTSYGLLADFIIVDEIVHWRKRDLWDSLLSSAAKRARCMVVIISNAGFGESWQWELRESVRTDPAWYFSRLDGPVASWITEDRLAEQRRLLPLIAFNRLWRNRWSSGSGDALAEDDIQAALRLRGPLSKPERGWMYVAGLDLGLSRDKAALCVLGKHFGYFDEQPKPRQLTDRQRMLIETGLLEQPDEEYDTTHVEGTGRLKLAQLRVWDPKDSQTGKVDIEEIEDLIVEIDSRFKLQVGCDPWQAAYLIERLQKRNVPIEPVDFTGQNLKSMCSATLEAFSEGNLDLYPDPQLLADLRNLRVVEKSYGVRLDSPRGVNGHGDAATALAISLHLAKSQGNCLTSANASCKLIAYP